MGRSPTYHGDVVKVLLDALGYSLDLDEEVVHPHVANLSMIILIQIVLLVQFVILAANLKRLKGLKLNSLIIKVPGRLGRRDKLLI